MDTMPDTEGGASAADVAQGAAADVGAPKSKKGKAKTAGAGQRGVGKRRGKHRFDRRKKSKVSAVPPTHTRSCMPSGVWDAGHATANTTCMHTCTWVHCAGDPAPNPRIPRSAAAAGPAHTHRRGVATPPARTTPLHAVDDLVLLVEPCMLGDFTWCPCLPACAQTTHPVVNKLIVAHALAAEDAAELSNSLKDASLPTDTMRYARQSRRSLMSLTEAVDETAEHIAEQQETIVEQQATISTQTSKIAAMSTTIVDLKDTVRIYELKETEPPSAVASVPEAQQIEPRVKARTLREFYASYKQFKRVRTGSTTTYQQLLLETGDNAVQRCVRAHARAEVGCGSSRPYDEYAGENAPGPEPRVDVLHATHAFAHTQARHDGRPATRA